MLAVGVRRRSALSPSMVRVYSYSPPASPGVKALASLPPWMSSAARVVSELSHVPPRSAPRPLRLYMMRITSPLLSEPFSTVNSLKPKLVNQSFSVPIQPDSPPPSIWDSPLIEEI